MEDYIEGLKKLENRLRESYVEIDGYNREKFIEIMAVDGAFLMDFLLIYYYEEFQKNDRIFGRQRLYSNVRHELLLLENQVPLFFLEYLFSLYKNSNNIDEGITLMKIMQKFIIHEATPWKWCSDVDMETKEKRVHHLLHLLIIYLSPSKRKMNGKCPSLFSPTISELHRAGVKFKTNSSNCLSSINFTNGILKVPKLRLTDDAEMIFRNMQACEQCHLLDYNVGDYIFTMDMLINNEEDIKVLVHNGIISNWLENNQVAATMFNNLGKGNYTNVNDFSYASVVEDLNAYYKIRRHKWKATLKQKYFNNPWTIVSIVAAAFLLLLTFTLTVFSILQVV